MKYRENEKNEKNTSDPKQGQKFWFLSMRLCFGKLLTLFAVRSLYNLNIWLSLQTNDFIDRNIRTDKGKALQRLLCSLTIHNPVGSKAEHIPGEKNIC